MELLDQLEERITSLLSTVESLKEENTTLKTQVIRLSALEAENGSLKGELLAERQRNEAAVQRVDSILQRLKDLPK